MKSLRSFVALAISTTAGVGYAPIAPGTFGSAAGLVLWWFLPKTLAFQLVAIVVLFAAGSWSGTIAEEHFKKRDPGHVVLDEVMGMFITLLLYPRGAVGLKGAIAGFFLFRLFDIVKPPPARALERLPGGAGIMADDAMAAVYANLALRLLLAIV
ncbi:MAG TPA: phosphatidylglycerophosphatase A [Vicinamibacterales bacterium]|jgi:phosphatidylglycerophosphatase A|nr:phosphatidylglycerophosphatase A [Vicinamibacterales bacterium]